MRRRIERQPAQLVSLNLLVDRDLLAVIDSAARVLGVDRQAVLLQGFDLLTYATFATESGIGHCEHSGMLRVS